MKSLSVLFSLFIFNSILFAGDDSSGPVKYIIDLGTKYHAFQMGTAEKKWSASLIQSLNYEGEVVHFVRTSIILKQDDKPIKGAVYQAVEKPDYFYVVNSDVMLRIGNKHPYSPGVGGFSLHRPKSKSFIVCLSFQTGGVPTYNSTSITKGLISWHGHDWDRFK